VKIEHWRFAVAFTHHALELRSWELLAFMAVLWGHLFVSRMQIATRIDFVATGEKIIQRVAPTLDFWRLWRCGCGNQT
jgi:hypothetical protein